MGGMGPKVRGRGRKSPDAARPRSALELCTGKVGPGFVAMMLRVLCLQFIGLVNQHFPTCPEKTGHSSELRSVGCI